jgi:DNA-binding NarL/FixJ family response regulator
MPAERPSVFRVGDHSFLRAGMRRVLTDHGFAVVGDAPNGEGGAGAHRAAAA